MQTGRHNRIAYTSEHRVFEIVRSTGSSPWIGISCLIQGRQPVIRKGYPYGHNGKPVLLEEITMSTVEEIKTAIDSLPVDDYVQLRDWFTEKDWENWDRQLEQDVRAGRLDFLAKEALEEKAERRLREL